MKRRAEPRTFSEREATAIKKVLSSTPQKGPVDIFLPMGDEETTGYGLQLEALFAAAGWKAGRTQGMYRTGGPPPVFVLHVGQNNVPLEHPYFAVKAALEAAGLKYAPLVKDLNAVPGGVVIILPPKPKVVLSAAPKTAGR